MKNSQRRPEWLKVPLPGGDEYLRLKSLLKKYELNTVCESASCPNMGICWGQGTLTLMILGDICTRSCRFCDVMTGRPAPPKAEEPEEVARLLSELDLRYVVITSVDRDDLSDGGAGHWAETLHAIRIQCPQIKLEALIPDFQGNENYLETICLSSPDVLSHNLETVASLQGRVRMQGRYEWSLKVLEFARSRFGLITKSGLMLGLGENPKEVIQTMQDLVDSGCQILSLGQYLQPSRNHFPVAEFISPKQFQEYKEIGETLGFAHIESGPLVRSSFQADLQARLADISLS